MRRSFEIGLQEGRKWTLCVDADVLLRQDAILMLLLFAERQSTDVLEVQGMVFDKFFNMPRQAGNHLYRTSLLDKAMKCIPEEGVNIRPEGHMLHQMKKRGYPWVKMHYVVGLHDFEQYYSDVYRKNFVHARKHLEFAGHYLPHWKKMMQNDKDFEIAMTAFAEGVLYKDDLFIDKNQELYKTNFEHLNMNEKETAGDQIVNLQGVEDWLQELTGKRYSELNLNRYHPNSWKRLKARLAGNSGQSGIFLSVVRRMGVKMQGIGK